MAESTSDPNPLGDLADEFLSRFRRGERPALTEFIRRRPELEQEIRELFPALVMMEDVRPGPAPAAAAPAPAGEPPFRRLGDYHILREIGRGGMGVVYVAVQESLGRRVALKVLPPEAAAQPRYVARFQREARAAARLHHTNIVPVFGVGEEGGTHYYVMQYIDGRPLDEVLAELRRLRDEAAPKGGTATGAEAAAAKPPPTRPAGACPSGEVAFSLWHGKFRAATGPGAADNGGPGANDASPPPAVPTSSRAAGSGSSHPLSDPGRPYAKAVASIGAQAADALEYAAGQGVLHRDVKPSNLLLDVFGTVWLADFGLAKATGTRDLTAAGDLLGTLRYMAPERFQGRADVRSDVYALGLTLYEMLALRPAFDERAEARLIEQISSTGPPRLDALDPALPRDLVMIVHKALAADPADRYQSARALADDLRRFLDDRPIAARRVSAWEQVWRWRRRNPLAAGLAAAISVSLAVGTAISVWQAVRATRAEQAETARAEGERRAKLDAQGQKANAEQAAAAEKSANAEAQKRLGQVEKANEILGSIFDNLDPRVIARADRPLQAILTEKLDKAMEQLEGESIGDPLVVAAMQDRFGRSLIGLGEPGKAAVLLEKARATRQARLGADDPDTLASANSLAEAYLDSGKGDLALPLFEETLTLRKARLGPEDPGTLDTMNDLARAYLDAGRLDLAVPLFEETLRLRKARLGPDHPDTLQSMYNLAVAYKADGKLDLALPLCEETLKLTKARLGPDSPDTLRSMDNLALAYCAAGKLDLALSLLEETLRLTNAKLGPNHPDTLAAKKNLEYLRNLSTAPERYRENLARLGPDHLDTLLARRDMAQLYLTTNRLDEGERILVELIDAMKSRANDEPIRVFTIGLLRGCLTTRERTMPDSWLTYRCKSLLGGALLGLKKYDDAEPLLIAGYEGMRKREAMIPPEGKPGLAKAVERLVQLYEATDKKDEAAKWRKELETKP
jgi:serine/threonine protein kinase